MKNLLLALIAIVGIGFTSCGDDDPEGCQTCAIGAFGFTVDTEYCQDGDNVIQTVSGVTDTIPNTTVAELVSAAEATGADCN